MNAQISVLDRPIRALIQASDLAFRKLSEEDARAINAALSDMGGLDTDGDRILAMILDFCEP